MASNMLHNTPLSRRGARQLSPEHSRWASEQPPRKDQGPEEPSSMANCHCSPGPCPLLAHLLSLSLSMCVCVLCEGFHAAASLSREISASLPLQFSGVDKKPLRLIVHACAADNGRFPWSAAGKDIWFLLIYWRQAPCGAPLRTSSH